MTTLSDLTLKQLTTAFGALAQAVVSPKTFNTKHRAASRLEALLAEKGLTLADALRAAGIKDEAEVVTATPETAAEAASETASRHLFDEPLDDGTGIELELEEDADIPGTEDPPEPGMVFNQDRQVWEYLETETPVAQPDPTATDRQLPTEPDTVPTDADEPNGTNNSDPAPEANDEAPVAPTAAEAAPSAAAILVSNKAVNDTRDWLVRYLIDSAGLEPETAVLAALRAVTALKLPEPSAARRPRTGSKQDIVIGLLRRPEGATLGQMVVATGWQPHSCRGFVAGALKKRLGLAITSSKNSDGVRVYRLTGPSVAGLPAVDGQR
jgi:hypothetical protein